ncbi:MAG: PepSY domain-containing protein, partial [Pseudomonadota bacterium]|nr:PepSY domain-containing protein [Pseudomonadota bacterium]
TGTFIWLNKRARQGRPAPRLAAAWWGMVYGVPVALVATFIARLAIGNTAPFVALFWSVLALTVGVALLRKRNSGTRAAEPVLVPAE